MVTLWIKILKQLILFTVWLILYVSLSHNALLEREHPAVGVEGEGEVVLDAEAEEYVLQRRAPGLVRLGEGDL